MFELSDDFGVDGGIDGIDFDWRFINREHAEPSIRQQTVKLIAKYFNESEVMLYLRLCIIRPGFAA
jgi:hypothetical protein